MQLSSFIKAFQCEIILNQYISMILSDTFDNTLLH